VHYDPVDEYFETPSCQKLRATTKNATATSGAAQASAGGKP
jgi:hypothetical protein